MTLCKGCGVEFEKKVKKQIFCSRPCQVKFNGRKNNGDRSKKYYSRSPRNFFQSLLQKKAKGRENLTLDFLVSLWENQKGLCALSGTPMTHVRGEGRVETNVSLDRIDSSLGYTEDNVQLVCHRVNTMKLDGTEQDLLGWCKKILNKQQPEKQLKKELECPV